MEEEIWKPIPSCPRLEASSLGRIRLEPKQGRMPNGGYRTYGGTPTYGQLDKTQSGGGRYHYQYYNHTLAVSRLVCEAFHGPPPFEGACALHEDENPLNNKPDNLKWGTQKENLNYPKFIEYCRSRTGDNNPLVKGRKKDFHETSQ